MEEFTALRHEIKLQTRGSRTLEERLEAALTSLDDAAQSFRSAPAAERSVTTAGSDKSLVMALTELDEALDRSRQQWQRSAPKLIGSPASSLLDRLDEPLPDCPGGSVAFPGSIIARLGRSWNNTTSVCGRIGSPCSTLLMDGQGLVQQRLRRSMAAVGLVRIRAVGRLVDPDQMVVIEVVAAEGTPGQVTDEVRPGYTWQGQVLRPAEVRAIRPRFESASES